jgi:hypothetical protein
VQRIEGQKVIKRGLCALYLGREHRLFTHEGIYKQVRSGQRCGCAVQPPQGEKRLIKSSTNCADQLKLIKAKIGSLNRSSKSLIHKRGN